MLGFLIRLIVSMLALGLTVKVMPGFHLERPPDLFWAALLLGVLNAIVRPIAIFLTLPINIVTLGLFTFVINAAMLRLTDHFIDGFRIDGWQQALLGAIVLAIISAVLNWLVKDKKESKD